jgi:cell division protein ZapE
VSARLSTEPNAGGVASRYDALVRSGTIEVDPAQRDLVARLDALATALNGRRLARKSAALGWLFGQKAQPLPKGLYVWGSVGRGKTMLMDMFFSTLTVTGKRRTHFHAYLAEVHERIHDWRQKLKRGEVQGDDPIRPVAEALAAEAWVLCFDEFAVTDIADAMILGRLFKALFEFGVVVVSTSNVPPEDLYKDGLNRALFLPFIDLIGEKMDVMRLDARTDFRLEKIGDVPVYFSPGTPEQRRVVDDLFSRLVGGAQPGPVRLMVHGHPVDVPCQAMGVARIDFADLCERPLGASDYIVVARAYHTIILENVPRLGPERKNEARRLITLIDVLYERKVKLFMVAETGPDDLYSDETGAEAFEFTRTISRLHEMGSRDYLAQPRGRGQGVTGNVTGLVET